MPSLPSRAASSAASLQTLASSAPAKPGVCPARRSMSSSGASVRLSVWTFRMAARSRRSGRSMRIWRSKRPGRSRAESRMSGRFVAAIRMTPLSVLKPSISTSSWLSVFSRSSLPPMIVPRPRERPTASISSMKMMQGAFSLACLKRSRTRAAPTPTNISTKSEPESEKKGTPASPATAFARRVLPVPGGPTRRTPLGSLPPSRVNRLGLLRNCTTSSTSSLASSNPATSAKVIGTPSVWSNRVALFLPMFSTCWPGPPMRRRMKIQNSAKRPISSTHERMPCQKGLAYSALNSTGVPPASARLRLTPCMNSVRSWSAGLVLRNCRAAAGSAGRPKAGGTGCTSTRPASTADSA